MKLGFEIVESQGLQTDLHMSNDDFTASRISTSVIIPSGKSDKDLFALFAIDF